MKQVVSALYLRMSIALLVRCAAEAPPVSRNAIGWPKPKGRTQWSSDLRSSFAL